MSTAFKFRRRHSPGVANWLKEKIKGPEFEQSRPAAEEYQLYVEKRDKGYRLRLTWIDIAHPAPEPYSGSRRAITRKKSWHYADYSFVVRRIEWCLNEFGVPQAMWVLGFRVHDPKELRPPVAQQSGPAEPV